MLSYVILQKFFTKHRSTVSKGPRCLGFLTCHPFEKFCLIKDHVLHLMQIFFLSLFYPVAYL